MKNFQNEAIKFHKVHLTNLHNSYDYTQIFLHMDDDDEIKEMLEIFKS